MVGGYTNMDTNIDAANVPADQEEVQSRRLAEDYFYSDSHQEKEIKDSSISRHLGKYHWCAGFDSLKKNNLHILSADKILYAIGCTYHIFDINTGEDKIFFSRDGEGIGALAVHPNRAYFAVGEKGEQPNVYIYEYPSGKLYRILRKGTEKMFSCMCWSASGKMLATVGSSPDFMLTVWDWMDEKVILKSKAFGQEVYRVTFSPKYEQEITTSGTAHIRFWKMAKTFTGLKLQGDIGKFGQVELSDICGYVELPDGKVLSGSEYGNLLLWEGALIKAVIVVDNEKNPCHKGSIECILIDGDEIMSSGTDGYIRWWDINEVMQADPEEGFHSIVIPKHQVLIGEISEINNLIKGDKIWFSVDRKGKIWKISEDFLEQHVLLDFHSGKIMDIVTSPECNAAVTIGEDGSTRLWDFINQKEIYATSWHGKGMCVSWAIRTGYNQGKIVAAGFDNGLIRLLYLGPNNFELLYSVKVHDSPVIKVKFAPNGKHFVSAANDNSVFFFEIGEGSLLEPVAMTILKNKINNVEWHTNSEKILVALNSGNVAEITRPEKENIDISHSFEVPVSERQWRIRMMDFQKKKPVEDDILAPPKRPGEVAHEEEEWPPAPILAAVYDTSNSEKFIISVDAPYNDYLYMCEFGSQRPIRAISTCPSLCQNLFMTSNFLISSHNNGTFLIYSVENLDRYLIVRKHDSSTKTKKAILNPRETYVISVAEDSTMFITEIFPKEITQNAKTGITMKPGVEPKYEMGIDVLKINEKPPSIVPLSDDITDTTIYSLQMDKLKTDEDKKRTLAEMKKERKRQEIALLRAEFEDLQRENSSLENKYQLTQEELQVDPEYTNTLYERNQALLDEAQKEIAWYTELHKLLVEKYKRYFLDSVAIERFKVRALHTDAYVTSFRVMKPSEFLVSNLATIQAFLEEEGRIKQGSLLSETESMVSPGKFSQHTVDQNEFHEETKAEFRITSQQVKKDGKKKSKAQEERERRSKLREERKTKIENKKKQEPNSESYDPMDLRDIETAKATMGDFKLKTSPEYVVPKSLCVNASQKRRQMFLLMESSHNLKMELNSRLLALRENKSRLIDWIREQNKIINEIDRELGVSENLFEPKFMDDEWPENYYKVEDEDLNEYTTTKALKASPRPPVIEGPTGSRDKNRRKQRDTTDAEKQFKAHHDLKLLNEKKHLKEEIKKRIEHFDEALRQQQEQKYLLESDLKQIDMKLITFFQELNLLDAMEPDDQRLTAKIEKLNEDKQALLLEINEINKQYELHQQEQEEITQKHKEIYGQFNKMVEGNTYAKELQAVLDRNIKRKKKKKNKESEEEDEDESEEESSDSSDESDEDDDQNLDIVPGDCDPNLFEEVVNLREARLDLVDRSNAKKLIINDLKKKQEDVEKKEKNISKAIQNTEKEIQEFQREKMQKLNQIMISIILSQDQIQIIENNRLPENLEWYVLFTNAEFDKLRNRIIELIRETEAEKARKNDLDKEKSKLEKNNKRHEKKKEEEKKKFEAVQALRFGHAIKLENLKYAEPSDQLAKLKNDFIKAERDSVKKIEEAKSELSESRENFREVTKRNTMLLEARSKLFESIMKKNKQLDIGNKEIFKEEEESKQGNITQEQMSLKNVLDLQKAKIAELKTEISLFRRKGGHIYTKITANRRANMS